MSYHITSGAAGSSFLALALAADSVPTLNHKYLQMWLDFCASFLNLAEVVPDGKAQERTLQQMQERVSRMNLSSRL